MTCHYCCRNEVTKDEEDRNIEIKSCDECKVLIRKQLQEFKDSVSYQEADEIQKYGMLLGFHLKRILHQ